VATKEREEKEGRELHGRAQSQSKKSLDKCIVRVPKRKRPKIFVVEPRVPNPVLS